MNDEQTVLFGSDATQGIVSIEVGESAATIYVRDGDRVTETREAFAPWLLVSREEDVPEGATVTQLEGDGYRFVVSFSSWMSFTHTRSAMRSKEIDLFAYPFPEKQFMVTTGKTLFKGLTFDDVYRMQIDLETADLSAEQESARILLIAVSDNRGFETILEGPEPDIIRALVALVQERNPDVIEGHNFFGFDLPYLSTRAARHGIPLALGRDGSDLTFGTERNCPVGGYSRPFTPARIQGRHIIDTLLAVQRFDVVKGRLERYGLKECARVFGLSEPERVLIPGDEIGEFFKLNPDLVKTYALHDVRETRSLAALICPAEFYLTQMTPDNYQNVATTGTGEKINALMVREYLRRGHAIPKPEKVRAVAGGYTEIRRTGLIQNVVKCDVESLYPSLMLSRSIKPKADVLNIFLPALNELTGRRIDAKLKSKYAPEAERPYWDGLQSSFKILINSFYGYLGAPFNFNDPDAAERVTTSGQAIVKKIAQLIEERGGDVIEIDTDGVYFEAPPGVTTEEDEFLLVSQIGTMLPEGIRLAHDGRYAAMLSLKIKNYVLIEYDGTKVFRGASVRSRADELFGRDFISRSVDLLIGGDLAGVSKLYKELSDEIIKGKLGVEQFSRRERVTTKTFSSMQKKRTAAIAQGINIGDYVTLYERRNGELGLVDDYDHDEDRDYLLDKLYKFACRLRECFGDDFDTLFPAPTRGAAAARRSEAAGQQTMSFD
jgi:DNA polymerase elongation subunit (family B)